MIYTRKISILSILFFLFFSAFSQEVIQEKTLQKKNKNSKFYSVSGIFFTPEVYDCGNSFVIELADSLIGCDDEMNIRWRKPKIKVEEHTKKKNILINNEFTVVSRKTFYKIKHLQNYNHTYNEIIIASYDMASGKHSVNNISFEGNDIIYTDFFALSDGLYYLKLQTTKEKLLVKQFLGKIDESGKLVNELALDLPFSDNDISILANRKPWSAHPFSYKVIGVNNDDIIYLIKGYSSKSDEYNASITILSLNKNGKLNELVKTAIPKAEDSKAVGVPSATLDTVNNTIYITGYILGTTNYKGFYVYNFDITTKESKLKNYFFETLNTSLTPSKKIRNIPYTPSNTQTPGSDFEKVNNYLKSTPDIYNKMVRITTDIDLDINTFSFYIDKSGDISQVICSELNRFGGCETKIETIYNNKQRTIYTARDYYESHLPSECRYVGYSLNRNEYSILIIAMEANSIIQAKKFKTK